MKILQKIIVAIFISAFLVACATTPEDRENNQNVPEEENRNDQLEEPGDDFNRDDQLEDPENDFEEDDSRNQLDRDPDNENILPELETEDEDNEDR